MKSNMYATTKDGKIAEMSDCTHAVELKENQIPLTRKELALLRACDGDLELAKDIIRAIEKRIAAQAEKAETE